MNGAAFVKENQCDFIVALAAAVLWMLPKRWHLWPPIRVTYGIILWAEAEKVSPCRRNRSPLYVLQQPQAPVLKQTNGASSAMMNEMKKPDLAVGTNYSPVLSIIDPELMKTVPPKFTAYQGFDALFHATECYISKGANMMSDMYALTAIENIASYLARAVKDGNDIEAREHVAFANTPFRHCYDHLQYHSGTFH